MRTFESLTEQEILALAVSLEEEDERIYADYAEGLRKDFPATAALFEGMREEESGHRRRLIDLYRTKFGEHIPLIRRHDVRGFVTRRPVWLMKPLRLDAVRKQAETLEVETRRFYEKADRKSTRLNSSHQIISNAGFCLKKKAVPPLAPPRPGRPAPRACRTGSGRSLPPPAARALAGRPFRDRCAGSSATPPPARLRCVP